MTTVAQEFPVADLGEPILMTALQRAASSALGMSGIAARCVGISTVPTRPVGDVTGMVAVHGRATGFVMVNMSETCAVRMVDGLLHESHQRLNPQVIDGVGEIANLIAGSIKSSLANSQWSLSGITVPSVIIGAGYHLAYARGIQFFSAAFDTLDTNALTIDDRLLLVSASLIKV